MDTTRTAIGFMQRIDPSGGRKPMLRRRGYNISPSQLDVLKCLADGRLNREICEIMGLSLNAVEVRVHRLMNITGTATRCGLVAFALRRRIIE